MKIKLIVGALFCLVARVGWANQPDYFKTAQCASEVRSCFNSNDINGQKLCFEELNSSPICARSRLGALMRLRWSLTATTVAGGEVGPTLFDQRCLKMCDTQLMRALIDTPSAIEPAAIAESCYARCEIDERRPMLRP